MIEQLAEHGVTATDLVPSLVTTHTVPNPEYDPEAEKEMQEEAEQAERFAKEQEALRDTEDQATPKEELPPYSQGDDVARPDTPIEKRLQTSSTDQQPSGIESPSSPKSPSAAISPPLSPSKADNLLKPLPSALLGVSTTLTAADKTVTLDIRWTILCDLFLALVADSVYDARSRVLLGKMADHLGLTWMDVVRFERRLTEALELQEGIANRENKDVIENRRVAEKKMRYAMIAAATLGGGLVIGLSAGLLAPVIGAGLGAALTTVGVSGSTAFLGGVGGAAVITTTGVGTGSYIGSKGMMRRTKAVSTFDFLPLHNNKRLSTFVTVPGCVTFRSEDLKVNLLTLDQLHEWRER